MSRLIVFEKLSNTRDLGGQKTLDGRTIRPGRLFRSGHLSELSNNDMNILSGLIRTVVDFRSDAERLQQPDMNITNVENIHIPIVDSLTAGISREKEADQNLFQTLALLPDEARKYMCDMYRAFTSESSVNQYRRFVQILLETEGPVLWHCTAGKDRAGIGSVIIEEILGVGKEDIIEDYLKTNDYIKQDITFLTAFVKKKIGTESSLADEALHYLFGAEKAYINSFYDSVERKYNGMDSFIRNGLGIDEEKMNRLREKYLEP